MLSYWLTYGRVEYNLCVISYFPLVKSTSRLNLLLSQRCNSLLKTHFGMKPKLIYVFFQIKNRKLGEKKVFYVEELELCI